MKKDNQLLGTLFGIFLIVAVVGLGAYFHFIRTKAEPVEVKSQQFGTDVIASELKAVDAKNVFLKTVPLRDVPQSSSSQTNYDPSELGKEDLSQRGQ